MELNRLICFVEIKIYISLKQNEQGVSDADCFVEIKIYISLKQYLFTDSHCFCFVEIKIYISLKLFVPRTRGRNSFVEIKIYISLKPQIEIWRRNFEFRYKKMDRHRSRPEGNLDKIFI